MLGDIQIPARRGAWVRHPKGEKKPGGDGWPGSVGKDIEAMAWMVEHGATIRGAARVGGCDESTLRYHLRRRAEGAEDGRRRQPEAVGRYGDVADAWIERQRAATAAGQRPEAVRRLYEELVERGYEGSYKAVLRYVRRRMEAPRLRPFRRVEVAPGSLRWRPGFGRSSGSGRR